MTVELALAQASKYLSSVTLYPTLDAEVLLSYVMSRNRSWLIANPKIQLTLRQIIYFFYLVWRRRQHQPIAYVVGKKEFYGRPFFVNKNVLIPRPDSELLVEQTELIIKENNINNIIEIGTGSGCLAVTLALRHRNYSIIATDISRSALIVAKRNAILHGVSEQITFIQADLLKPIYSKINSNTLLISNLPYLKSQELIGELTWEPALALDGGKDGLNLYSRFFIELDSLHQNHLPKYILLELHPPSVQAIKSLLNAYFPSAETSIINDLSGRPRVLKAKLLR